jgi:hypothetical protein
MSSWPRGRLAQRPRRNAAPFLLRYCVTACLCAWCRSSVCGGGGCALRRVIVGKHQALSHLQCAGGGCITLHAPPVLARCQRDAVPVAGSAASWTHWQHWQCQCDGSDGQHWQRPRSRLVQASPAAYATRAAARILPQDEQRRWLWRGQWRRALLSVLSRPPTRRTLELRAALAYGGSSSSPWQRARAAQYHDEAP